MKKYKISLGTCGGRAISISIIRAQDEQNAVVKRLESIDEEVTEDKIDSYLEGVFEHMLLPRKKDEINDNKGNYAEAI